MSANFNIHTYMKTILVFIIVIVFSGCSSLPKDSNFSRTYAYSTPTNSLLSKKVFQSTTKRPNLSGFLTIHEGINAFDTRIKMINSATKSIDAQYYIWHNDISGNALFHALLLAADRGVRVRLLLDDLDAITNQTLLSEINSHSNIHIRLFNPITNRQFPMLSTIADASRINRRMHNKSLTIDNLISIFGGRNIGDEYFSLSKDIDFNDIDILTIGPVVNEVSMQFDLYWNSVWSYPLSIIATPRELDLTHMKEFRLKFDLDFKKSIEAESMYVSAIKELRESQVASINDLNFEWSKWSFIYDKPDKIEADSVQANTHLAPKLKEAIDKAQSELIIISPYFVPRPTFSQYLIDLESKGVNVLILTNSFASIDVPIVHSAYQRYRKELLKGGIEIYEYKSNASKTKGFGSSRSGLHAKAISIDNKHLFIGSFNFDPRSVQLNLEMGALFESENEAKLLSDSFKTKVLNTSYKLFLAADNSLQWLTIENGQRKTYDIEPKTSHWDRFKIKIMSIFAPEKQL